MPDDLAPERPVDAATVDAATVDAAPVEAASPDAEGGATETPARAETPSPSPATAVLDLRDEVPSRHRPTRGVPREPDRHLAAYRNRAARPVHRHERRPRLIEVEEVTERPTPETATEPVDATATTAPLATEAAAASGRGDRTTFDVGELVVRRMRLRSVLKVSLAFYLCLFAVVMLAGAILWRLANEQGWVTGWTGFLVDIGFTDADVDGATLARASAITGGILVVTATLLTVAMACFYNQISGLVGGLAVTFGPREHRRRHRR